MFSELSAVGKIIQQDLVDVQQHHHKHKLLLETLRKPIHHHHHDEENNDHHFFRMANIEKVSVLEDKIPKTSDYEPLSWACFGKCKKSRIDFLSRITNQEVFQAMRLEQEFMGENVFIGFSDFGVDDSHELEQNKNLLHICYKSHVHHGFLLVIDTVDVSENYLLNELPLWVKDLRSVISDSVPIVLIGNNADKRDALLSTQHKLEDRLPLSTEQGEKLAEKLGCFTYIEMEKELSMDCLRQLLVKIHIIHQDLTVHK
ncbi:predicted protein [Naegleria gruberi]|uniref:Predicted protein n=1 Tax=Naegleria gruberi TaxID=5762 RepID=D2W5F5_NAEGR|nr:uncharacterized protein NAEGRDRAFT_76647 [Naegleria gruberi]EFC35696.1 predicted protein [Naegleria gruberi]|eukprot:XP_002668440.1 predicted protein [Naegleria gruberi strain NEG-M]